MFNTHRANSFFVNDVLMRSDDLSDGVGPMLWWLVLGLTLTWVACFLCVMRGAESAGKAVWITMPLPYLMLLVLLFKGMSLAGSGTGVQFYLGQLDLHALGKGEAWIDAIAQIFFGLSICCGAMPVSVLHSRTVSFPYTRSFHHRPNINAQLLTNQQPPACLSRRTRPTAIEPNDAVETRGSSPRVTAAPHSSPGSSCSPS